MHAKYGQALSCLFPVFPAAPVPVPLQAVVDGSLALLLEKQQSQPQVFMAYRRNAPLRDKSICTEVQAALLQLKVPIAEVPVFQLLLLWHA
jgi:hypothetical protein